MASRSVDSTHTLVVHPVTTRYLTPSDFEDHVEVGLIETATAVLGDNDVAGLGCKFVQNLGIPGVADQDPARSAIWRLYRRADAEGLYSEAVRRFRDALAEANKG